MEGLSIWHWLIVFSFVAVFWIPMWRITRKAGYHGAMSILAFVPGFNILVLWAFAFAKWPVEEASVRQERG